MKKEPTYIQALARCPECKAVNKIVTTWPDLKTYHMCSGCNSLQPTELYYVICYTNDMTHPLWPDSFKGGKPITPSGAEP